MPAADQTHLRKCIDDTKGIPDTLRHQLLLIKEYDRKCHDLQLEVDSKGKKLLLAAAQRGAKAPASKKAKRDKVPADDEASNDYITWAIAEVEKLSDDKFKIATELYDLIDRHIQRLDSDLRGLEEHLGETWDKLGIAVGGNAQEALRALEEGGKHGFDTWASQKQRDHAQGPADSRKRGTSRRGGRAEAEAAAAAAATAAAAAAAEVPEEALKEPPEALPDEPRYCTCQRGSWGAMISCDNEDCPIEWFHYGCVGITEAPAEDAKWYCPMCRPQFAEAQAQAAAAAPGSAGASGGKGGRSAQRKKRR